MMYVQMNKTESSIMLCIARNELVGRALNALKLDYDNSCVVLLRPLSEAEPTFH